MTKPTLYKLERGEAHRLARLIGCSPKMVKMVCNGQRNQKTKLGEKIIKAAKDLIQFNRAQIDKFSNV